MSNTPNPKEDRIAIPLGLDGMFSAGDPGAIPDGYARKIENMFIRPGRVASRPPFTYDSVMNVNGLANYDDGTNKVTRLVSIDSTQHLRVKSATAGSETWGAANATTISGTRLTDSCNYRSVVYAMIDNGSGLPSAAFSFDGTNVNASPFNSAIQGRTVTTFIDRLFIGYPRVTVAPVTDSLGGSVTSNSYVFTGSHWVKTNVTAIQLTEGVNTINRLYPTSTTNSSLAYYYTQGVNPQFTRGYYLTASAVPAPVVWRLDMRCLDPTYRMPYTMNLLYVTNWWKATAYSVGDLISTSATGGTLQRCTTAGTSQTPGPPTWATTVGATTTDGTVTWTCEAVTNVIGAVIGTLPSYSDNNGAWTGVYCPAMVPGNATLTGDVAIQLVFGNTISPTISLAPVDVSLQDTYANGDPRKRNYGSQMTAGDFYYPFCNITGVSGSTSTQDMPSIVWSEIADPKRIRAVNTYSLIEAAGDVTAATTAAGRYIPFKRNALWKFQGTADPDNPLLKERCILDIGCLGPRALDVYEDEVFFVGENEIYRMRPGSLPQPMCGDGMREEIMNKSSSTWVESQSTYKRPVLKIDKSKLIVWVYTQKAKLYAYDLRTQKWTVHTMPNSAEVDDMLWNRNTSNFYVAFASGAYGLARMDYTQTANDTIDNTVNTYSVDKTVIFRPIELYDPPRFDSSVDEIRVFHGATASQTGQTVTASYSSDQGVTYPKSTQKTLATPNGAFMPVPFVARQNGPSVTVKLVHSGKAGETAWSLSPRAYAFVRPLRTEVITTLPTEGSSSL